MSIRVALHHRTSYEYDRTVTLFPQIIRLRPAPHGRTPIVSYSQKVQPGDHFLNWQLDPHGNYLARYVFTKPAQELCIEVDLVADLTVINPFDFFLDSYAEKFPFTYEAWLGTELSPFLLAQPAGSGMRDFLATVDCTPRRTVDFLVALNSLLHREVRYLIRLEPGVQTPEETLTQRSGSCRDTA